MIPHTRRLSCGASSSTVSSIFWLSLMSGIISALPILSITVMRALDTDPSNRSMPLPGCLALSFFSFTSNHCVTCGARIVSQWQSTLKSHMFQITISMLQWQPKPSFSYWNLLFDKLHSTHIWFYQSLCWEALSRSLAPCHQTFGTHHCIISFRQGVCHLSDRQIYYSITPIVKARSSCTVTWWSMPKDTRVCPLVPTDLGGAGSGWCWLVLS